MNFGLKVLSLGLMGLVMSCGGGEAMRIDIDLDANGTSNPMITIENSVRNGTSFGLFFEFTPLTCRPGSGPSSVEDVEAGAVVIQQPLSGGDGYSSVQDSYSINMKDFQPYTYYKVYMVARERPSAIATHEGVIDCPFNPSLLTTNNGTICFGLANSPGKVCPDTIPFADCETSDSFCQ